jgi:inosine triphosphate pyrophosphatase
MYFITGNVNKFEEAKAILGEDLEMLDLDLDEVQSLDPKKIIRHKLDEANKKVGEGKEFFVEDTSLCIECLGGLPGALVKWFLKSVGAEGIYQMTCFEEKCEDKKAWARTMIGYRDNTGKIEFFEGNLEGSVVSPQGETTFGWDPIFVPKGHKDTFAQMSKEEKNSISMRKKALEQLKAYREQQ